MEETLERCRHLTQRRVVRWYASVYASYDHEKGQKLCFEGGSKRRKCRIQDNVKQSDEMLWCRSSNQRASELQSAESPVQLHAMVWITANLFQQKLSTNHRAASESGAQTAKQTNTAFRTNTTVLA
jgi:hypothetical protein